MSETNKIIKYNYTRTQVIQAVPLQHEFALFLTDVNGELIKWEIHYCYNIYTNWKIMFDVRLKCLSENSPERTVSFTIHVMKGDNIVKTYQNQFSKRMDTFTRKSSYIHYQTLPKHGDVYRNDILCKGLSVKTICDITFEVPTVCIYDNVAATSSTDHSSKKFDNLKNFFDSDNLSDVKIVAGGEEFRAHKLILSLRSKVFAAMFSHDMLEKSENLIKIKDVDAGVMREMLRFVYVDKIQDHDKLSGDLLAVADKYEIEDLKELCEQQLMKAVNLDNFHSIFALADLHRAQKLKKYLIEFLAKKTEECSKV